MISWRALYRIGAGAAWTVLALMPLQMIVFLLWPPPTTVDGWFTLFHQNPIVGLIDMDLLLAVDYVLLGLVFLALWAALRLLSPSLTTIAVAFELLGIATYFASATAFEMLTLSNQYAAAETNTERGILLAAGRSMLVTWQGTAFSASYLLAALALFAMSAAMLRSGIFSATTAYVGIIAGALNLVPPTVGTVGVMLSLVSLVPTVFWLILVARQLARLA